MPEKGRVREVPSSPARRVDRAIVSGAAVRGGWVSRDVSDRACLIADLRSAILNGTYHHDAMTIADRMLDRIPSLGAAEL